MGHRRLFDLWRYYINLPFSHILTVPRKYTEAAHKLYYEQVSQFKESFEKHLNIIISDEALLKSTNVLNESRALLKKLYEFRKRTATTDNRCGNDGSIKCQLSDA